jgi:hypothetical protein
MLILIHYMIIIIHSYISIWLGIYMCVCYIYKTYFYTYLANNSSRTNWVELIQAELTSFIWVEPSLYEYVSFSIRTYYCVRERLIYYSNWDRIEFNRVEFTSSWAHLTPLYVPDWGHCTIFESNLVYSPTTNAHHPSPCTGGKYSH